MTNEERSALEISEFLQNKPKRYFLYINEKESIVTTTIGEKLGNIIKFGRIWKSNIGDKRQSVWIRAITGDYYQGTYYKSAGDYARVKLLAGKTK